MLKTDGPAFVRAFFACCLILSGTVVLAFTETPDQMARDIMMACRVSDNLALVSQLVVVDWLMEHEDSPIQRRLRPFRQELEEKLANIPETYRKAKISPLAGAAYLGEIPIMQYMIDEGEDVNPSTEKSGITPLSMSLMGSCWPCLSMLVEHGADLSAVDADGETLIYGILRRVARLLDYYKNRTCEKCEQEKLRIRRYWMGMIEKIIKAGCDPDRAGYNEHSPLVFAVKNDLVLEAELLIRYGVDINQIDNPGTTPLTIAILEQHEDAAELLLQYGALPDKKNERGEAPLIVALKTRNLNLVKLLVNYGADLSVKTEPSDRSDGESVLATAMRYGCGKDILLYLLDAGVPVQGPKEKHDALQLAINFHHENLIPLLLAHGAGVNKRYMTDRRSLLHIAAYTVNLDAISILVNNGLNINAKNTRDETPLHYAIIWNRDESVNRLLQLGANPWLRDKKGRTPLNVEEEKKTKNNNIIGMLRVAMDRWRAEKENTEKK